MRRVALPRQVGSCQTLVTLGHAGSKTAAEPGIPAVHALHLADVVARFGVGRAALFRGLVDEARLSEPEGQLNVALVEKLVERARTLSHEPGLGVHFGLQMRVSAHGYLGFAAMAAPSLRASLSLAAQFAPTRTSALSLELVEDADAPQDPGPGTKRSRAEPKRAALVVRELADFGTARDVVLLALMVGLGQIGQALTGQALRGTVELALPAPAYATRLRLGEIAGQTMRFGRRQNRLLFDAELLDLPLQMADPVALQLALAQCERALDALGGAGIVSSVRARLAKRDRGFRSLPEVAEQLAMSPRTLKRRLAEQGLDFRTLLEEARHARALDLLRSTELSLDEIAERLGYSDVANFGRAFRRWAGTSPAARRKELGEGR